MKRIVSFAASAALVFLAAGPAIGGGQNGNGNGDGDDGANGRGVCNAIIAGGLGAANRFVQGVGDPEEQCTEVGVTLEEFLETEGCVEAFVAGELPGIAGAASGPSGALSPLGEIVCGALCGCGFFPDLPEEICDEFDCP